MSKKDLPLIIAGVGVLYLITRSSGYSRVNGSWVPTSSVVPNVPGVGSIVTSISNLIGNLFHPGVVTSNPGTDVINTPGAYPNVGTPGPYDSGDPCDSSSVQYNPDVCAEMGG